MKTTTNTLLVGALVVVVGLFVLFGAGAMTGTMMNGGFMGTGWTGGMTPGAKGGMGGISWMWIPTIVTLVLGVLLGWVLFGKRASDAKTEPPSPPLKP